MQKKSPVELEIVVKEEIQATIFFRKVNFFLVIACSEKQGAVKTAPLYF